MKTHFLFNNNVRGKRRLNFQLVQRKIKPCFTWKNYRFPLNSDIHWCLFKATSSLKHHCFDDILRFCFLCLFLIRNWGEYSVCLSRTFSAPPPYLILHSWRLSRHGLHRQVPLPVSPGWIWTVGCTR